MTGATTISPATIPSVGILDFAAKLTEAELAIRGETTMWYDIPQLRKNVAIDILLPLYGAGSAVSNALIGEALAKAVTRPYFPQADLLVLISEIHKAEGIGGTP